MTSGQITLQVNGKSQTLVAQPLERLSDVLRHHGYTGTKTGCDAGDCGACSVMIDGELACACLVPVAQVVGSNIETVEGLAGQSQMSALQNTFAQLGAAQCGICTPGMLITATRLLKDTPSPSRTQVEDALGGVLCRCTGYRKIVDAVVSVGQSVDAPAPAAGAAIGARVERLDGIAKINGSDLFGADVIPSDALRLRLIRSPMHSAAFEFGDIDVWVSQQPGVEAVFTSADIPGRNCFGVIPPFADQVVFAESFTRFKGEAVAAVVGAAAEIKSLDLSTFPVNWQARNEVLTPQTAMQPDAALVHESRSGNVLVEGLVQTGNAKDRIAASNHVATGHYTTPFIEHAYIEPEAGLATRVGDRIEIHTCTQTAGMAQEDLAAIMDLPLSAIRVLPTSVGGGFGSKLDLSIQPFLCLAAWRLNKPVAGVYSRIESMQTTTKRHPSDIHINVACDNKGKLTAIDFEGVFNTGAYASWGPTVANRVPIHASGPYYVPNYRAHSVAVHTNTAPAGAFRGFGVPQAAIALECVLDKLAEAAQIDKLQFRLTNALNNNQPTVTGQVFKQGVGINECLKALEPAWQHAGENARTYNQSAGRYRKGCGLGTCWYGCGNTSLPNPSTIKIAVDSEANVVLHQGAIDIGQGANTVMAQIAADTLGVALGSIVLVGPDTDVTPDAGKTSASRQTFVTGNAVVLAATALRETILREVNASADSRLEMHDGQISIDDGQQNHRIPLTGRECDGHGYVFTAIETYDPPTSDLDENGQGEPYAQYGYGAQLVELTVDMELGTVKLDKLTSAHDVGRAINPLLIEGQIEGGATQGIGMALMEEFIPGVAENLHDYLIPTIGDIPEFEHHIIEVEDAEGPYGAKGLGEHVLIPTAPAILNAIRDASGAEICDLPATPDKVLAAIQAVNS